MKLSKQKYLYLIIISILIFAGFFIKFDSNHIKVNQGLLDLSEWDSNLDGNIKLDGQWEFYWNKLLSCQDLQNEKPDLYAKVPGVWNEYKVEGAKLSGEGYATYRLHVDTGLPAGTMMGLRMNCFSSACDIYINDQLLASNGNVSTKASEEIGEYRPQAALFPIPASEFDIIIHVSNFHYPRGGFWFSTFIGNAQSILKLQDSIMAKAMFLSGALMIIALFYCALYFLHREQKYALYFSLLCLFMMIVLDIVGQRIIPQLFSIKNLNIVIFLWYSSSTWLTYLIVLYAHELFPSNFSNITKKIFLILALTLQVLFVLTSPMFYTRYVMVFDGFEFSSLVSTVIIVAISIQKGNKDGWLHIISMIILMITYVHDVLFWLKIIESDFGEIFFLGVFIFILLQMIAQAERIRRVNERKNAAELILWQAQIKPHFLYNALNTISSVSRYDVEKARNLLVNFSQYLRRNFDFKDLSQYTALKNEIELARAYVEIEKARFEERLEVSFELPEDLEAKVPILVLQPLIENAVIHGILPKAEGGRIEVAIKREKHLLVCSVKDNGVGMDAQKIHEVLNGENEKGIGLANINKRLLKIYGKGLDINSNPGSSTEIKWSILLSKKRN